MRATRRAKRARLALGAAALLITVSQIFVASGEVLRDVVFVANAEGGTVSIIDTTTFQVLRTLNVVPDGEAPSFQEDPVQAAAYPFLIEALGVNLAQDLDVSSDGRTLYVSRGHRGDVAAFDIATGAKLWRAEVGGMRADHMTISADGSRLYVSAISESEVEVFAAATGAFLGSFPTGDFSHDNVISPDGARVYNGSVGNVLTPWETRDRRPEALDAALNESYQLTIADAQSLQVLKEIEFDRGIRPFMITADEAIMYAQLSELHGLVEYSLTEERILRTTQLPIDEGVTEDDYDFEAPHHGLALSPDEQTLCAAGRASDYVALVSTETLKPIAIIDVDDAPGWAENSPDGTLCFVASTRADTVSVISYATRSKVATIPAGDGPKYIVGAQVPEDVLGTT